LDAKTIHEAIPSIKLTAYYLTINAKDMTTFFEEGIFRDLGPRIYNECYNQLVNASSDKSIIPKDQKESYTTYAKSLESWKSVQQTKS
jgi:hypothetical protein